jgi:hypothetical protein
MKAPKIYVSMKRLNFIARFAINAIMEKQKQRAEHVAIQHLLL